MSAGVTLENLVLGYQQPILGPVSLHLKAGIHVLLGRNGAGKTTLMRTIAGILPPLSGKVQLGQPGRIGYLGHRAALSEGLTVEQNLKFWQHISRLYAQPQPLETLTEQFDLQHLLPKRVRQLSRGQRQRADLARLSLVRPDVLLLDEPLTGLDPVQARYIRQKMQEWSAECPLIYSTHSLPEALEMTSSFLLVQGRGVRLLDISELAEPEIELLLWLEAS
ncbi:Heme-transporting ATPase (plasmid) [Deinococcus proteolyticus MRP]|uniref:Heme-transporting ATPase n=1 Tax=Deinococcus proteolyticus (strain ATCC 35074 / DSM 20540 / JCM 6276 / NBRC 101906 / NCIMB 13154 / VKM Ac-1939 / CCM 2703 / MRP) TaxID=693977 RepID=F0RR48_DEIPM|nr:ABC transporter ATP-binding protein [Deinococcus proteolyticus]ADY27757.1 Heme-transporting ATPase [Deinococcus proteolyticus MRP]